MSRGSPRNGFSLVELSIVLVILGLLTGGILAGQSLIRAAELRSVSGQASRYRMAIFAYRDRYMALPGDHSRATDFFGTDPHGCPVHTTRAKTMQTCNGNGDGVLGAATTSVYEIFRAWQHLAAAGLVEGSYTGIAGNEPTSAADHAIIGDNVPVARLTNAGFSFARVPLTSSVFPPLSDYYNMMLLGANDGGATLDNLLMPVLKAGEAWSLDVKLDDGRPSTGWVRARVASSRVDCTTSDDASTATYRVTSNTIGCDLLLLIGR